MVCFPRNDLSYFCLFCHLASDWTLGSLFNGPFPHKQEASSDCISTKFWASSLQAFVLWFGLEFGEIPVAWPQSWGEEGCRISWLFQGLVVGIWNLKNEVKIRNKRDTLLLNLHTRLGLILVVSPRQLNWKAYCSCIATFFFISFHEAFLREAWHHHKRETYEYFTD